MKRVVVVMLFSCLVFFVRGQEPTFRKNFDFASIDVSGRMIKTSDGNYLFCGFGTDFLPINGYVTKIDQAGTVIWSKSVTSSISTAVLDVIEISAGLGGGYLLAGESSPGAILVRLDNNGNLVWAQRYQYPSSQGEFFNKVIQTSDGNFLACGGVYHLWDGTAFRDSIMPMAIKVNPTGGIIWDRAYYIAVTNPDEHAFTSVSETTDGYVFVGYSSEGTGTLDDDGDYPRDGLIVKTNSAGTASYFRKFGDAAQGESVDCSITLSTGNVLMAGYRGDYSYLLRILGTGGTPTVQYSHRYNGGFLAVHAFYEVMEAPDGHYAILGSYILPLTFSFNSTVAKFNNSTGALIASSGKSYSGGMTSILPKGGITSTGSYYMMMMSMSGFGHNFHVIKTDVGGLMNNPACPEGSYAPSRTNYTPTLNSISPTVHGPIATATSFVPVIATITPTEIIDCQYAPCVPPPAPTLTANPSTPVCVGTTVTISASGSGSNVTYYYYTVPTGGTAFASGTSTDVTPSGTTTYYVDAQDNTNPSCYSTRTSITITVNQLPNPNINSNGPVCQGQTINLSASNGVSYSWTGPSSFLSGSPNPSIPNATPSNSGTYYVTVADANCSNTASINVTVNTNPVVNLGPDTTICSGSPLVLDAGAGFSSYVWTPAGSTQTINVNSSGAYSVVVTDGNTCQGTDAINVSVITQADATITTVDLAYCTNEPPVNFTATDGGGIWSGSGITNSSNGTFNPSTAGPGSHNITYSIAGQCGDSDMITVNVNAPPVISLGPDTTLCTGNSLTLDAGAGFSSYTWTPSGAAQTYLVNTGGTYSVVVTDANSCQGSDAINVSFTNQADATITTVDLAYCTNESSVNFTATDPGGTWSGSGITNVTTGTFSPSTAGPGTFNISYTISGQCGDADMITVNVFAAPVVNLGPDTTICSGNTLNIDAGVGYSSYAWTPSGNTQTINVTTGGTYSVVVTDGNACQGTDDIVVNVVNQADATITTTDLLYCTNDSPVNFTAIDPGGIWSGTGITNATNGTFNPLTAGPGTYNISYNITGQCGDSDMITVNVFAAPQIDLGPDTSLCIGQVLTLDAGAGYSSYTWNPSGASQTIDVTTNGTYSVIVTDGNSCQGTDAIVVVFTEQQDATIITEGPFCENDDPLSFEAEDDGGVWSGNGITPGGLFTPSSAGVGSHTITYYIAGGCGDSDTQDVEIVPAPQINLSYTDASCIGAEDGTAQIEISVGLSPYSIVWSNTSSNDSIFDLAPGTYDVIVIDANGCRAGANVTILDGTDDCFISHIYIPNVFSPNGDGQNDAVFVRGEGIDYLEFVIYDRWGEKIFETTDQNIGWDGNFKEAPCPPAVYTYYVKVTFYNTEQVKMHGTITLVK